MHAFVDESYNEANRTYIVSAAIIDLADHAAVRTSAVGALQPGRNPGAKPFHWNDEWPNRRKRMLRDTVVAHGIQTYVFTRTGVAKKQQESARAACLGALLAELAAIGVGGMTWDQRGGFGPAARDLSTIQGIVGAGVVAGNFAYSSSRPSVEPLLRLADCIAGAANSELQGDLRYVSMFAGKLQRRVVP